MTPEQKMKAIIEAAGECVFDHVKNVKYQPCYKCGKGFVEHTDTEPFDLTELFRLADKAGIGCGVRRKRDYPDGYMAFYWPLSDGIIHPTNQFADTPAEALLNALYDSIKEQ